MEAETFSNRKLGEYYFNIAMAVSKYLSNRGEEKEDHCWEQRNAITVFPTLIHDEYLLNENLPSLRRKSSGISQSSVNLISSIFEFGPKIAEHILSIKTGSIKRSSSGIFKIRSLVTPDDMYRKVRTGTGGDYKRD